MSLFAWNYADRQPPLKTPRFVNFRDLVKRLPNKAAKKVLLSMCGPRLGS
jgi:hypothetical protein